MHVGMVGLVPKGGVVIVSRSSRLRLGSCAALLGNANRPAHARRVAAEWQARHERWVRLAIRWDETHRQPGLLV